MNLISANSVLAYPHLGEEGLCVKGGIYTSDKCPICGKTLRDNKKNAVTCPDHPEVTARKIRIKFGSVRKRFRSYENQILLSLRRRQNETHGGEDGRVYIVCCS